MATDDTLWKDAPARRIKFDDMVQKRKDDLLKLESMHPPFEQADFACYSEDEIQRFAFDIRTLLLSTRAKHAAICTRCQARLEFWTKMGRNSTKVRRPKVYDPMHRWPNPPYQ